MRILIIESSDNRYAKEADKFEFDGDILRLYRIEGEEDLTVGGSTTRRLIAAYWGILGFEVLED